MMLDRKYSAHEVAEVAARGTAAMESGVPNIVVLAAHVAAADAIMADVETIGRLSPDFQRAALALHAVAILFLLVCETGPVSGGTPS
jgi:DUF917 family protein